MKKLKKTEDQMLKEKVLKTSKEGTNKGENYSERETHGEGQHFNTRRHSLQKRVMEKSTTSSTKKERRRNIEPARSKQDCQA